MSILSPARSISRRGGRSTRSALGPLCGLFLGDFHLAYRVLRTVLESARKAGRLSVNPATNLRLKVSDRRQDTMRVLTPHEIKDLAAAVPKTQDRFRALIPFLAYTGLRLGEAAALRVDNVDLLRREVRVLESAGPVDGRVIVGPTKTGYNRVISWPKMVVAELERHFETYPPRASGILFATREGSHLDRHDFYTGFGIRPSERPGWTDSEFMTYDTPPYRLP